MLPRVQFFNRIINFLSNLIVFGLILVVSFSQRKCLYL